MNFLKKHFIQVQCLIVFIYCFSFAYAETARGQEMDLKGEIHAKYSKKMFSCSLQGTPLAEQLAALMLDLFNSADGQLRFMVTPDLLEKTRTEQHVELLLEKPFVTTPVAIAGQEIMVSKLLIPLEGKFAWTPGQRCMLYYGNPEIEEFNVLTNIPSASEHKRFIELLKKLEAVEYHQ